MNILFVIILIIFLGSACCNHSRARLVKADDRIFKRQVKLNNDEPGTMWPSFTNDNSYIHLLGLFIKQRSTFQRHFQTVAEPAMFRAAILLSQYYNITVNGKRFAYRIEETSGYDVIETLDRTCVALLEDQVVGIIGPEYSSETKIISTFANRVGLPVMGYSTTDPDLSNRNAYKTFYRLPPSDITAAQALLKLFQKYNWNSTNVIYQSDNYGEGGLKALTDVFNHEIEISRTIEYDLFTNRIDNLQRQLKESPSRIVIIWANTNVATQIIELAIKVGDIMAPSFVWILAATNSTMSIVDDPHVDQLAGVLMLRLVTPSLFHIPTNTDLLNRAIAIWKNYDPHSYAKDPTQIDIFALYAFDAAWSLILAIVKHCQQNPDTCLSFTNTSSCYSMRLANSDALNHIIQTVNFTGVSGHVQFQSSTTDRIDNKIAHYVMDNLQPSTPDKSKLQVVEVLKLNGSMINSGDKNIPQWLESDHPILWPSRSQKPPTDYAQLDGETLNITVYLSPPFFMTKLDQHNISQPSGYIHDLVKLLQTRMKFNYNYIEAPTYATYDELVDCVANNTYEIVMADLSITSSRRNKIDFSYPFFDNTLRFVIHKSKKTTISPFAFLKPFSLGLWLLIIFVIYFFSALLIGVYEFYGQNPVQVKEKSGNIRHDNRIITTMRAMYHSIGALLQRGSELQPRTFFGRFQTFVIWMMSIVLVALLTSNLTAYLSAQREKSWLTSIEDLRMCRKVPCHRIGILKGSQHEEYFREEIMNGYQMNYYYLKQPNECYSKLLEYQIDVAVADSSSADYFTQTPAYCQLEIADISFAKTYYGIAVPKDWRFKRDLDNHITDLKTNGEIDRLLERWFQQKTCDHEHTNECGGLGGCFTILEASGLFYIYGPLTALNFLIFISKQIYAWYKRNRSNRTATFSVSDQDSAAEEPADSQNAIPLTSINSDTASSPTQNSLTHRSSTKVREETQF